MNKIINQSSYPILSVYVIPGIKSKGNAMGVYNSIFSLKGVLSSDHVCCLTDSYSLSKAAEKILGSATPNHMGYLLSQIQDCMYTNNGKTEKPDFKNSIQYLTQGTSPFVTASFSKGSLDDLKSLSKGDSSLLYFKDNSILRSKYSVLSQEATLFDAKVKIYSALKGKKDNFHKELFSDISVNVIKGYHYDLDEKAMGDSGDKASVLNVQCNAGVWESLDALCKSFEKSFRRKAFVHCYTSAGMDEMEMSEACSSLQSFSSQLKKLMGADDGKDEEEEEDEDMMMM
jgi:hypothetical protein